MRVDKTYSVDCHGVAPRDMMDVAKTRALAMAFKEFDYANHEAFVIAVDWRGSLARCHVAVWDL